MTTGTRVQDADRRRPGRLRLGAEFGLLFLLAPLVMALLLPPGLLFPAIFAITAAGIVLLHRTPGFRWADLVAGIGRIGWGRVALLTLATTVVALAVVLLASPGSLFGLVRANPALMATITVLYPLLSALPQEIVFRPLFFRRYGAFLPARLEAQVALNAAVFAYAHLMYWSLLVTLMTFAGGLAFAWSYRVRQNFPEAVLLHALAGIVVFAAGLGVFFYSGNITRPF